MVAGQPTSWVFVDSWVELWSLGRQKAAKALINRDLDGIKTASQILEKALRRHQRDEVDDLVMRAKIWQMVGECSFALAQSEHFQASGPPPVCNTDYHPMTREAKTLYKRALKSFQQAYRLFLKTEGRLNPLTG